MPKKQTKKQTRTPESISDLLFSQLQKWAHAGTDEGIKKLEDFIISEPN